MIAQFQQKHQAQKHSIPIQGRIPIKNIHLVHHLLLYNNQQILVAYDSYIHIHSTKYITKYLPSLVYVLQLNPILNKIQVQTHQDELSRKISKNTKNKFGNIIFGDQLNVGNNKLMNVDCFANRVRYLGSQSLRIRNLEVHALGHLLINFQDVRSVFIRRNNPLALIPNYQTLYNIQQPIVFNNILQSSITSSIFIPIPDLTTPSILFLHNPYNKQTLQQQALKISRITITDKNETQIYTILQSKKLGLNIKGFMNMKYVDNYKNNNNAWALFLFYNRLEIVEIGKWNNKNKTFQILSHRLFNFKEDLQNQYIINSWFYQTYFSDNIKQTYYYLLTSSKIWILTLNLKQNISQDQNLKLKTNAVLSNKSHIYFINRKGKYYEYIISQLNQPSLLNNLIVQTDNGVLVKLQANTGNYKEGWLWLAWEKGSGLGMAIERLRQKDNGSRVWVNFEDIGWLKNNPSIKKQILKQLSQLKQRNKIQQASIKPSILTHLMINIYSILQHHLQKQKQLTTQLIKSHLKLLESSNFINTDCSVTGKRIITEDVVFCQLCKLYSMRDIVGWDCCYICWNANYRIQ